MKYNKKNIGERIRECRKAYRGDKDYRDHAPDQAGFGALLIEDSEREVHPNTISSWENGKTLPELKYLLKMCDLFDCELGYLLCEYDTKTRAATDIQKETGLSEAAINKLRSEKQFYDNRLSRFPSIKPDYLKCDLLIIDAFIVGGEPIFSSFDGLRAIENFKKLFDENGERGDDRWNTFRKEELALFNKIYDDPFTTSFEKYEWFMDEAYKLFNIPEEDIMNNGMDEFENKQFLYYDYKNLTNLREHNISNDFRSSMTLTFNQIIDSLLDEERLGKDGEHEKK